MKIRIGRLRQLVKEALGGDDPQDSDVTGDEMQAFVDDPRNYRGILDNQKGGRDLQTLMSRLNASFGNRKLSAEAEGALYGVWPGLMRARRLGAK